MPRAVFAVAGGRVFGDAFCGRAVCRPRAGLLRHGRFPAGGAASGAQRGADSDRLRGADCQRPPARRRAGAVCRAGDVPVRAGRSAAAGDFRRAADGRRLGFAVGVGRLGGYSGSDAGRLPDTAVFARVAGEAVLCRTGGGLRAGRAAGAALSGRAVFFLARSVRVVAGQRGVWHFRRHLVPAVVIPRAFLSEKPVVVCLSRLAAGGVDVHGQGFSAARLGRAAVVVAGGGVPAARFRAEGRHGRPDLAAAAARPARRGAVGRAAARRGGFFQLVRHHDFRRAGGVFVDGLAGDELRLADEAGAAFGLFQPVLHARF